MSYRFRYIEKKRDKLHGLVDDLIDSLYETSFDEAREFLVEVKIVLDKITKDIKEDEH